MALLRDEWLITAGGLCLAIVILSDRFLPVDDPILDFVVGVLTGGFHGPVSGRTISDAYFT